MESILFIEQKGKNVSLLLNLAVFCDRFQNVKGNYSHCFQIDIIVNSEWSHIFLGEGGHHICVIGIF